MVNLFRKQIIWVAIFFVGLASLFLYIDILTLPLSFDDLLHIRFVKSLNYRTVWLPVSGFNFYRPILLLPLLITRSIFGYYPQKFFYGLNLLLFVLNNLLFVGFVWRLWRSWWRALTAGLLLCSYPFAYQVVAVFGNNIYLILIFLILLGLHAYLSGLTGRRLWWWVTAVIFGIGLLSHELMILFGFFAMLTHWTNQNRVEVGGWSWNNSKWRSIIEIRALIQRSPFVIFIITGILYTLFYQLLPLSGAPLAEENNSLNLKILYFLQSVVYIPAALANKITGLSDFLAVVIPFLFLITLSIMAGKNRENQLPLLLGWGWWGMSSLLLLSVLPTDYILHGPRLLYLGSLGACLIWAILLDELFRKGWIGRITGATAVAIIVLISTVFIRDRLNELNNIGSPIAVIEDVVLERPLAEGVMLINFPSFTAPSQTFFPIGVEHVALMGSHLFAEEIIWENLNQIRPVLAIGLPELLSEVDYPYGTHVQSELPRTPAEWPSAGVHVFTTAYTESGIQTTYQGKIGPEPTDSAHVVGWVDFTLRSAQGEHCGEQILTQLTWEINEAASPTTSIFVHAVTGDGRVVGQKDGPPLQIRPDFLHLPGNWSVTDHRVIRIEAGSMPTELQVGLYDYQTGERLPASGSALLNNNAISFPIHECAQTN